MSFRGRPDTFFSNLSPGQVANLGNFDFATSDQALTASDASGGLYYGTITSIEMVTAPEPSTLIIFSILGISAMALRPRRER